MTLADLAELEKQGLADLAEAADEAALRGWNTKYFGEKGLVKQALSAIGKVAKEERPAYGQAANKVKVTLESAYESALAGVKEATLIASLSANPLDVTLPGRPRPRG